MRLAVGCVIEHAKLHFLGYEKRYWPGYDAIAQTRDVQAYIQSHGQARPYLLMLSWGPPHAPYETAPAEYQARYEPEALQLRPNVPQSMAAEARQWLAGYYAHCTALDDCLRDLLQTLDETGQADNTIFVFTSDHGDMLGSQGEVKKQRPWDESIRVPFLVRYPALPNWQPRAVDGIIDSIDIMPTLLGLSGLPIPDSVEGVDFSDYIEGGDDPTDGAILLTCPQPFGQWTREQHGGREYRGLRTRRYTYTRSLDGPWLLYDNEADPYQLHNRCNDPDYADLQQELDQWLNRKLAATGDEFLPGIEYVRRWGYTIDETGTVPYTN
jgi:arylsulfatase A-like enzyme